MARFMADRKGLSTPLLLCLLFFKKFINSYVHPKSELYSDSRCIFAPTNKNYFIMIIKLEQRIETREDVSALSVRLTGNHKDVNY